jgi:glycosyltransferase involved in cell wall biosynthesis
MRIVTYHPRARTGDGGITNSVRRLSEGLARAGAEPVIAFDGHGRPSDEDGVQWFPVSHSGRGRIRVPITFGRALEGADLAVLNSGWSMANVRAGAVARHMGVPYVLAPRGAYDPRIVGRRRLAKRIWWTAFERRLVRGATAIHVFFDSQREDLEALGYHGPVLVAPNGVRVPTDRRWDGGSGGYIVYLGRFDPEHKGIDLLLDAVAALPVEERPKLRLHGPDWQGGKAEVIARTQRLGLAEHVAVGEAVYGDAKWDLLARAVGLVYPSRWEGFGNSLAEAAALGVPSLATPYPLARFLEERGACIVTEAEPSELAAGLRRLCAAEALQVGERAARVVAEELDWDMAAQTWLTQAALLKPHETGMR